MPDGRTLVIDVDRAAAVSQLKAAIAQKAAERLGVLPPVVWGLTRRGRQLAQEASLTAEGIDDGDSLEIQLRLWRKGAKEDAKKDKAANKDTKAKQTQEKRTPWPELRVQEAFTEEDSNEVLPILQMEEFKNGCRGVALVPLAEVASSLVRSEHGAAILVGGALRAMKEKVPDLCQQHEVEELLVVMRDARTGRDAHKTACLWNLGAKRVVRREQAADVEVRPSSSVELNVQIERREDEWKAWEETLTPQ